MKKQICKWGAIVLAVSLLFTAFPAMAEEVPENADGYAAEEQELLLEEYEEPAEEMTDIEEPTEEETEEPAATEPETAEEETEAETTEEEAEPETEEATELETTEEVTEAETTEPATEPATEPESTEEEIEEVLPEWQAQEEVLSGWQKIGGKWYYYMFEGSKALGWLKIDGSWYYFGTTGAMQTGWVRDGYRWYYFKPSGAMATDWQKIDDCWYYFGTTGVMQTGWVKSGSRWYYLKSSGAMATDWQKIDDCWYYFGTKGIMQTGWVKSGNSWYYLKSSGAMATNWQKIQYKWYYLGTDGIMATGARVIDRKKYVFRSDGTWDSSAAGASSNTWEKINGSWYYFESDGLAAYGWLNLNDNWYYLDPAKGGIMASGKGYRIDGETYNFSKSGVLLDSTDVTEPKYSYQIYLLNHNQELWNGTFNSDVIIYIKTNNPDAGSIVVDGVSSQFMFAEQSLSYDWVQKGLGIPVSALTKVKSYLAATQPEIYSGGWQVYKVQGGYLLLTSMSFDESKTWAIKVYEYRFGKLLDPNVELDIVCHSSADTETKMKAYAKQLAKQYFGSSYTFSWTKLQNLCDGVRASANYPHVSYTGSMDLMYPFQYDTPWGTYHVMDSMIAPHLLGLILDLVPGVTYVSSSDKYGSASGHAYLDVTYNGETRDLFSFCPYKRDYADFHPGYEAINLAAY